MVFFARFLGSFISHYITSWIMIREPSPAVRENSRAIGALKIPLRIIFRVKNFTRKPDIDGNDFHGD